MATIIDKRIVRGHGDRPGAQRFEMTVGFTVGDTMRRGSVAVTRAFYDMHQPPERVPLRYVPDEPEIREIDPDLRDDKTVRNLMIIALLVGIGVFNLLSLSGPKPT